MIYREFGMLVSLVTIRVFFHSIENFSQKVWEFSHKDNLVNFTTFLASLSDAWHILSSNLKHLNDQHVVQLQEIVTLQLDLLPHLINTEIRKVNNTEIALDEPF